MITIICPTYNEIDHIEDLLYYFLRAMPEEKELMIVDGGSTDGTLETIEKWASIHANIHVLKNKKKYVPFALNLALKNSLGDPVIRIDAHTEYSEDYFTKILETFEETDADIVGGPTRLSAKSDFQTAVKEVLSSKLGVGENRLHDPCYRGYTDHVTFGAWKRELFKDIGYFDEKLIRNQDDEFHYRAHSRGKRIFLNPDIKALYSPRNSFPKLFQQYFQYGYYKPIVLNKVKSEIKIRHLVPPIFSLYLISLPLMIWNVYYIIPLLVYLILSLFFACKKSTNIYVKLYMLIIYPTIHFSYGIGMLNGLITMFFNRSLRKWNIVNN